MKAESNDIDKNPSSDTRESDNKTNDLSKEDSTIINSKEPVSENSRKHFKYRSTTCLNCEQPLDLSDRYCTYCSQLNSTKQLSVSDFFGEFVNSLISFDSRLRYTLKDLLFKPGTITRNYVNGQRLKYANPFRFFLSVSIIYFLLSGLFNTFDQDNTLTEDEKDEIENVKKDYKVGFFDITVNDTEEDNFEKALKTDSTSVKKDTIAKAIVYISQKQLDSLPFLEKTVRQVRTYQTFYEETNIKSASQALKKLGHEDTSFNKWLYGKNEVIERISDNPNEFIYYLIKKIPFFLFFFTPIYALFFLLLYYKKKVSYLEHMVFIFHIFSFVFLTQLICFFPDQLLGGKDVLSSIILVFIGPFYFYKALRNFYKQSRRLTLFKFMLLNFIFWFGAGISAIFFFMISAAVY